MTTENDRCDSVCARGICRRDFLKLAVAAGLLAGCSSERQPTATPTEDFSQVSYCGIRCAEACPGNKYPSLCDSCKSEDGKHSTFWETCTIRACATERQVATCAHCDEYPECDDPLWKRYPILRQNIDQIRSDLEG